jgi:hypothetical protein
MKKKGPILVAFCLLLFLWGCSDGETDRGTLQVSVTGAPACGFDQVNISLSKIRIHENGSADGQSAGWSEIDLSPIGRIDLTSLTNGVLRELGTLSLPAGRYNQILLFLAPDSTDFPSGNSVFPSGKTEEVPLQIPGEAAGGLKLIHSFDVERDRQVDLALDFDACRSVLEKGDGGYLLKPMISVVSLNGSGQITGVISPQRFEGNPISNPVVTAQQGGKVIKSTVPDSNGNFVLSPLPESGAAGSYDVVFTADEAASVIIQSVPVKAQGTAAVGNAANPMVLHTASSRTVRGVAIPAGSTVRAIQSFSPGLSNAVMQVRYTISVLSDGDYQLTLSNGPPFLGLFGTGDLPIPLTPDMEVAGSYHLEASAEGFASEEKPVKIEDDLTRNFNLSPF